MTGRLLDLDLLAQMTAVDARICNVLLSEQDSVFFAYYQAEARQLHWKIQADLRSLQQEKL